MHDRAFGTRSAIKKRTIMRNGARRVKRLERPCDGSAAQSHLLLDAPGPLDKHHQGLCGLVVQYFSLKCLFCKATAILPVLLKCRTWVNIYVQSSVWPLIILGRVMEVYVYFPKSILTVDWVWKGSSQWSKTRGQTMTLICFNHFLKLYKR